METKQNDTGKMSRKQKVIVVVTAVTLAVILILMLTTRFMGSGNTYPIGDSQENSSTQTTAPSESPEETEPLFQRRISRKAGCLSAVFPTLRKFLSCQVVFLRNSRPGQGIRLQQYRTIQKRNLLLSHSSRKHRLRSLRNRKGEIRKRRRKNRKNRSRPRNSQGIGLMGRRYP